jgi:hypothetical protein
VAQLGVLGLQFPLRHAAWPLVYFVDDENNGGVAAEALDELEPVGEPVGFVVLAGIYEQR